MGSSLTADGPVALVTGSTRGIGWATARVLARDGMAVVITGHESKDAVAQRTAELREAFGRDAIGFAGDVADPKRVEELFREIFDRYKRLDVAVANAGILRQDRLGMISPEVIAEVFAVNLTGALNTVQGASR